MNEMKRTQVKMTELFMQKRQQALERPMNRIDELIEKNWYFRRSTVAETAECVGCGPFGAFGLIDVGKNCQSEFTLVVNEGRVHSYPIVAMFAHNIYDEYKRKYGKDCLFEAFDQVYYLKQDRLPILAKLMPIILPNIIANSVVELVEKLQQNWQDEEQKLKYNERVPRGICPLGGGPPTARAIL